MTPLDAAGIVRISSAHPVATTIDRLAGLLTARGVTIFARIDFSGDAARAGLALRAEQMLIFGNPKAGTVLMQAQPLAGLDLPLKALAYEDGDGKIWLAWNAPEHVLRRHGLPPEASGPLVAVVPLLEAAARAES